MTAIESDPRFISLSDIARALFRQKFRVILIGCVLAVSFGVLYITATPKYESTLVAVPSLESGGAGVLGSLVGNLGPLADIAGGGLSGGSSSAAEAGALLESRALLRDFIQLRNLLPVLYAQRWSEAKSEWIDQAPNLEQAVDLLERSIVSITQDRSERTVKVRVRWTDPEVAANWANQLVALANEQVRKREIRKAEHAIRILRSAFEENVQIEIRQVILRLIENHMQQLTLIQVREQYAFDVIDPAFASSEENPVSPSLLLFALLFLMSFGMAIVLLGLITSVRTDLQ